jgi:transcriptional regulator with XRE-family HTH domain
MSREGVADAAPGKRERPIVVPEFGRLLSTWRTVEPKRSRGVVCRQLFNRYGLHLDDTSLLQYERGTVAAPDPAMLWALARIYGANFLALVAALVAERTRRPLTDAAHATGPMDLNDDERSIIESLRAMPPARQRFYADIWTNTARRERELSDDLQEKQPIGNHRAR